MGAPVRVWEKERRVLTFMRNAIGWFLYYEGRERGMKAKLCIPMTVIIALTLSVTIAANGQQEKVPSKRGRTSSLQKSRNCQLNSMSITPSSFREDERITVKVVVICNQPVGRAAMLLQHWVENRGRGMSQKSLALTSGRNVVRLRGPAGRGGSYRIRAGVSDGLLRGTVRTVPVAWTAHKAVFH